MDLCWVLSHEWPLQDVVWVLIFRRLICFCANLHKDYGDFYLGSFEPLSLQGKLENLENPQETLENFRKH